MSTKTRFGAIATATLAVAALTFQPLAASAAQPAAPLPAGKADSSGTYGVIGQTVVNDPLVYGLAVDKAGSIWMSATAGGSHGLTEYRPKAFEPTQGDYLGAGQYSAGRGYLGAAFEPAVHYVNRDSTEADPSGGTEKWAEPRGIAALPGGGIAVSDTNGNVAIPEGTVLFFNDRHEPAGSAGFSRGSGCANFPQGELDWAPYIAVIGDQLFAPAQNCNAVSVFSTADKQPQYRLAGAGQVSDGPGFPDQPYGAATDGERLYTSDLGGGRHGTGLVQRWLLDKSTKSWKLDTSFATDGAIRFTGKSIYQTAVSRDGSQLYVIPQSGLIQRYSSAGVHLGALEVRDAPYATARDLAETADGWLVMTTKQGSSLRILAESPSPVAGLTGAGGSSPGSVDLAWSESVFTRGQAPVLDYVIEQSSDGGTTWHTLDRQASTKTTATITGLSAGAYSFRVTAYSEAGRGDAAVISDVAPAQEAPAIAATLSGKAPTSTASGNPVEWTASVTNAGNTPLTGVTATFTTGDENAEQTVDIGDLPVGESSVVSVKSTLTTQDVTSLTAHNSVKARGLAGANAEVSDVANAKVALSAPTKQVEPPNGSDKTQTAPPPLARSGGEALVPVLGLASALLVLGTLALLTRSRRRSH